MTPPIEIVITRLRGIRRASGGWRACCPVDPAHALKVDVTPDGSVLLFCHGLFHDVPGCPTSDVVAALGLRMSDLCAPPRPGRGRTGPAQSDAVTRARWGIEAP